MPLLSVGLADLDGYAGLFGHVLPLSCLALMMDLLGMVSAWDSAAWPLVQTARPTVPPGLDAASLEPAEWGENARPRSDGTAVGSVRVCNAGAGAASGRFTVPFPLAMPVVYA